MALDMYIVWLPTLFNFAGINNDELYEHKLSMLQCPGSWVHLGSSYGHLWSGDPWRSVDAFPVTILTLDNNRFKPFR